MKLLLILFISSVPSYLWADTTPQKVALGKLLFNDPALSEPAGQSCSSCHNSEAFYSDPGQIVSPGATATLFGNRNAPSISYVKFNPELYWDRDEQHWVGGFFLDGRARTLQDQAAGPFMNPLEMGNPNATTLLTKVRKAAYAVLLEQVYGESIWEDEQKAMGAITDAIAAYERGPEFAPFSSKYDYYLQGKVQLTALEKKGLEVFEAGELGNCAACHPSQVSEQGEPPLFTDFTYDNLGLPRPEQLPFYSMAPIHNPDGDRYIDIGLAANPLINNNSEEKGKFKVPTLRNIAKTGPYMHNGSFESLQSVVEFYNTRDTDKKWGEPEVADTVNDEELGNLELTDDEIVALVAFMETLSDGYVVE